MDHDHVCMQQEFNEKLNFHIDLLTKLEAISLNTQELSESDSDKKDLDDLYNSLNELIKNEIFALSFKTNQVKKFNFKLLILYFAIHFND